MYSPMDETAPILPPSRSKGSPKLWARIVFVVGLFVITWAAQVFVDLARDGDGPGLLVGAGALGEAIIPWFWGLVAYGLSGRRAALATSAVVLLAFAVFDRL